MNMVSPPPAEARQKAIIDWLLILTGLSLICLAGFALAGWWVWTRFSVESAPYDHPLIAVEDPVQTAVSPAQADTIILEKGDFVWEIFPKATYTITGRVLSREFYTLDWQSSVVPLDLAMGWGQMADPAVDEWITWRQANRWYYYRWSNDAPFTGDYIGEHSANIHLIPATADLRLILQRVGTNDIVLLEGRLVDLSATSSTKKWENSTSLTRTDKGNGACEIMYVERVVWNGREYR